MPRFRDRAALAFIGLRYPPWSVVLDPFWEALQIPLYTIRAEAPARYVAYAIVHCTACDCATRGVEAPGEKSASLGRSSRSRR